MSFSCYNEIGGDGMKNALLVGLSHQKKAMVLYSMQELENLAHTLDIVTVEHIIQDASLSSTPYKIGTGKVEEIKDIIFEHTIDIIIFNDELTNTQIRNLEEAFQIPVIDRTLLILEIFAQRAKTKEAKLQVEVAQLKYLLPRLTALRTSFDRQQGGIGSRGPGEKKLEMSRRKIEQDLKQLNKTLSHIVQVRKTNRLQRQKSNIKNVAIVGYTNAGKSTLMNTLLTHAKADERDKLVHTKDQVFATLETTTRQVHLKDYRPFTLTDTIGFVSNLPHDLVEAFKATLEEIQEADLLLHVIDFSHPFYFDQIATTQSVLKELGADAIETLYVFNKIDLTDDTLPHGFAPAIKISLKTQKNIPELLEMIPKMLFKDDVTVCLKLPVDRGDLLNTLIEQGQVLSQTFNSDGILVKARVSLPLRNQMKSYEI